MKYVLFLIYSILFIKGIVFAQPDLNNYVVVNTSQMTFGPSDIQVKYDDNVYVDWKSSIGSYNAVTMDRTKTSVIKGFQIQTFNGSYEVKNNPEEVTMTIAGATICVCMILENGDNYRLNITSDRADTLQKAIVVNRSKYPATVTNIIYSTGENSMIFHTCSGHNIELIPVNIAPATYGDYRGIGISAIVPAIDAVHQKYNDLSIIADCSVRDIYIKTQLASGIEVVNKDSVLRHSKKKKK